VTGSERTAEIEMLRAGYEAVNSGDWDALFSRATSDFELKAPDNSPFAGVYRGPEEAHRVFVEFFSPFEEVEITPEQIFERGDKVVVFFAMRCRPAGSSSAVENRVGHLWTMRDGLALRLEIFPRREEALKAAGIDSSVST
jgi:ketosteroid isomerase-like protein